MLLKVFHLPPLIYPVEDIVIVTPCGQLHLEIMNKETTEFEKVYDDRYAGDYMDSDDYSAWARADLRTRIITEWLLSVPANPAKLLDYGVGVGGWLPTLTRIFPKAEIYGVEISGTAIEKCRSKFPNFHFHQLNGNTSPLADESFDLIFSYHVLEHVDDIQSSIRDISRLLVKGGYAFITFPCGNPGSFLDRSMNLYKEGREHSKTGEMPFFFEMPEGHVRRLTSDETISYFEKNDFAIRKQNFSGHFFGTIDWLCRGTGPSYINRMFSGRQAKNKFAQIQLETIRKSFLFVHKILNFQHKDLSIKKNPVKQLALWLLKNLALLLDRLIVNMSYYEWKLLKNRKSGTAQYLIFEKI